MVQNYLFCTSHTSDVLLAICFLLGDLGTLDHRKEKQGKAPIDPDSLTISLPALTFNHQELQVTGKRFKIIKS